MKTAAALPLACFLLATSPAVLLSRGQGDSPPETQKPKLKQAAPAPTITVEASYPGADAKTVADTVAAPIEQQIQGVDKLLYMSSTCDNEGRYRLDVVFKPGVDLDKVQVLVQNRVSLAQPALPDLVKRMGVTVKKKPAGVLMIVSLSSPNGRYDNRYLSNYATVHYKDALARVPGVADLAIASEAGFGFRIWLDPKKLAAHALTADDVVRAIREQKMEIEPGQIGRPPKDKEDLPLDVKDSRPGDPDGLESVILKKGPDGGVVRVKDVGRVESEHTGSPEPVRLNGDRVVTLCVYALPGAAPRKLSAALQDELKRLRDKNPKSLKVEVAFDFAPNFDAPGEAGTPEYLLLDPALPREEPRRFNMYTGDTRTGEFLKRCEALLRKVDGVKDVLVSAEHPFDASRDRPCILVRLSPAAKRAKDREQIKRAIRTQVQTLKDGTVRLRDLSGLSPLPRAGYPIDLAIHGPEADSVRKMAEKLAERLGKSQKLTDLMLSQGNAPQTHVTVEIDRDTMAKKGVRVSDVVDAVGVHVGGLYVNDFQRFGRTWQVNVIGAPGAGKQIDELKKIKVRNDKGEMVPLADLVKMREVTGVALIERLNGEPMVRITANPAAEVSVADVRKLFETVADEIRNDLRLPAEYRLSWLHDLPTAK